MAGLQKADVCVSCTTILYFIASGALMVAGIHDQQYSVYYLNYVSLYKINKPISII